MTIYYAVVKHENGKTFVIISENRNKLLKAIQKEKDVYGLQYTPQINYIKRGGLLFIPTTKRIR